MKSRKTPSKAVEGLKKELEDERRKVQEYTELLQRLQADFENYRKRAERDKEEYRGRIVGDMALNMVDVYENLLKAVELAQANASDQKLLSGIRGVANQIESMLRDEGVVKVEAVGLKFNPAFHEAVEVVESDTGEGTVLEEVQLGYLIKGRLLRPAKVVVSKKKEVENNG
jgi:molecular chaperone GrpE